MRRLLLLLFVCSIMYSVSYSQEGEMKPCGTSVLQRHRVPLQKARSKAANDMKTPPCYQGEKRGLVILMSFPNQSFRSNDTKKVWEAILNQQGYHEHRAPGSVCDYFYDQSYHQFRLVFDVVGPVEAAHPYAYYGENKIWSPGDEFDKNDGELIEEACRAAADSISFADYDWDGDGNVDIVYVLYAGYGESDYFWKDDSVVWPHMGFLSVDWADSYPDALTLQGLRIDAYCCSNEITAQKELTGLGTICHEFSHCLGLPDLYNTLTGSSVIGYDDLMDCGNYNENGWCPPGYSSYERYACGWLTPETIDDPHSLLNVPDSVEPLTPLILKPDVRIWRESEGADEYYLIECRDTTSWDRSLLANGLWAWRINYDRQAWIDNLVNIESSHYRVLRMRVERIPSAIQYPLTSKQQRYIVAVFDLQGHRYASLPAVPGLYIIRYSDGSIRKVII